MHDIEKAKQIELMKEVNTILKINAVTCGDCGKPFLHRMIGTDLTCPKCGYTSECSDFGDVTPY